MTKNKPNLSIITVVFNGEQLIECTIKSVLEQNYLDYEYIIVDGLSSDNTVNLINQYSNRINKFICEKDNGIFDAMNKGLNYAKGQWVLFLNAGDMFAEETTLNQIFEVSRNINNYNLIYGDVILFNKSDRYLFQSKTNKWKINLNAICHQSVLIRRDIHPFFDTKYKIAADHAIIYPIIKSGKILYLNKVFSKILIGGVSSNLSLARKEKFKISIEHGSLVDIIFAIFIFFYNFFKEIFKVVMVSLLPYKVFQVVRQFKNQIEQL